MMTRSRLFLTAAAVVVVTALVSVAAQDRPAARDPRVGLKAGFRDAGQAIWHMELLSSLPKPDGFFDPSAPMGLALPPEPPPGASAAPTTPAPSAPAPAAPAVPTPAPAPNAPTPFSFMNSDLAFDGHRLFAGNFTGFNVYDIEESQRPRLLASIVCPGGQGDVSVYGHLLFMSVEETRGRLDCGTQGVSSPVSAERFRGVRIFDISNLSVPRQVAAVQTCRGSHTHTLVPVPGDTTAIYVYGSGTGGVRSGDELDGCSGKAPADDPNTALFSIDVIRVPLADPAAARIVSRPRIFADTTTGALNGLWNGGDHGTGTQTTSTTNQCHDITVYPALGLAAGACSGNGLLIDISDPVHPVRVDQVSDPNFAYWHSATFNNDGTKVVFTDEWGGGTRPRCRATDQPNWGADAIFTISGKRLTFAGYYKLPAAQTEQENCVAHNGSLIPVPGRDLMVQAWYQGGLSVFDFTDAAHPVEVAYFDRGPLDATRLLIGGYWSAYWFNGRIYASEIARGLDIFRLTPSPLLSQNEILAAAQARVDTFNPQQQQRITWPASATPVVGRAYLDQLARTRGISPQRAEAVRRGLDRTGGDRALATQLEQDAASAPSADATRLRALAALLRGA